MKFIPIIAIFLSSLYCFSNDTIVVNTKITKSTIFLKGAQVFREGIISLKKGSNKLVIENITSDLLPSSIQAQSTDDYNILDVKHNIKHLLPKQIPVQKNNKLRKQLSVLNDSINEQNLFIKETQNKIKYLNNEINLINTNPVIKGLKGNDTLPILKRSLLFYRDKLSDIEKQNVKLNLKLIQQQKAQTEMRERYNQTTNFLQNLTPIQHAQVIHQLIVTVYCKRNLYNQPFIASYMVNNAGWYPSYDIRGNDKSDSLTLSYKANIYQKTGYEWKDINIQLSTFNPLECNLKPVLPVWNLGQVITHSKSKSKSQIQLNEQLSYSNLSANTLLPTSNGTASLDYQIKSGIPTQHIQFKEVLKHPSFTNVEFNIEVPYTVPNSAEETILLIKNEKIGSQFKNYVVPKMDQQSYLVAQIADWENFNLLNGSANIYYNNTYLGQTLIDVWSQKDTLEVSMGRNKNIFVKRKKVEDREKTNLFTKVKSRTITIELAIKNISSTSSSITINDQLPVSLNEKTKVIPVDLKGAIHDEKTGQLSWVEKITKGEIKIINFTYRIEYH